MKTVFILWSGGLDSTYLIYKNLKEGNHVVAGTIIMYNNEAQILSEYKARLIMLPILNKIAEDNGVIFNYDMNCTLDFKVRNSNYLIGQLPIISIASRYFTNIYKCNEIQFGYVKGDDFYKGDFEKLLTDNFNNLESYNSKSKLKLSLPLKEVSKKEIINDLPKSLLNKVSYCETPTIISYDDYDKIEMKIFKKEKITLEEINSVSKSRINCSCPSCLKMNSYLYNHEEHLNHVL